MGISKAWNSSQREGSTGDSKGWNSLQRESKDWDGL